MLMHTDSTQLSDSCLLATKTSSCFDFENVFDSVFHQALWDILREYCILEKMIRLIKALYLGFKCAVLHEEKTSNDFLVSRM